MPLPDLRPATATRLVLLLAGSAIAAAAFAQRAPEKKLYCWDEGGRRVCGDALPASAVDRARTEISGRTGLPSATLERSPTLEERAAQAREAEQRKIESAANAARNRADMALAESYDSEAALQHAFRIRYDLVDEALKTAEMAIGNQHRALLQLLQTAAAAEFKDGKVPAKLAGDIRTQHDALVEARAIRQLHRQERAALDGQLAEAIARWRRARGIETPSETTADQPPATPAG